MNGFLFSGTSLGRREGVNPSLVKMSDRALQITPIDFGYPAFAGLRTAEDQHILFLAGKSKADGYKNLSYHQSGNALDFYAYVDGEASWDKEHLAIIAAAHLQAASEFGFILDWGGLWKSFPDFPHIQVPR